MTFRVLHVSGSKPCQTLVGARLDENPQGDPMELLYIHLLCFMSARE